MEPGIQLCTGHEACLRFSFPLPPPLPWPPAMLTLKKKKKSWLTATILAFARDLQPVGRNQWPMVIPSAGHLWPFKFGQRPLLALLKPARSTKLILMCLGILTFLWYTRTNTATDRITQAIPFNLTQLFLHKRADLRETYLYDKFS